MPYGSKKNLRIALRQDIFEAAVNYKADKDISLAFSKIRPVSTICGHGLKEIETSWRT